MEATVAVKVFLLHFGWLINVQMKTLYNYYYLFIYLFFKALENFSLYFCQLKKKRLKRMNKSQILDFIEFCFFF